MSLDLQQPLLDTELAVRGERPFGLRPDQNPLLVLLRKHWDARGTDRLTAARALTTSVHLVKTCNRIDELLSGKVFRQHWFDKLIDFLEVPAAELEAVKQETVVWREQCGRWAVRSKRLRAFAKRGPYAYLMAQPGWRPCLLGLTGDGYFYTAIPKEVFGPTEAPNLAAIIDWMREGPAQKFKPAICAGFLVHLQPEEIHFYTHEGIQVATGDAAVTQPEGFKEFFFGG